MLSSFSMLPDSPDYTFSMVSEPDEPQSLRFPLYCRLSGRLKSHLQTRLRTRLGPWGGPPDLAFFPIFANWVEVI